MWHHQVDTTGAIRDCLVHGCQPVDEALNRHWAPAGRTEYYAVTEEQILIGLLDEVRSPASRALMDAGINIDALREKLAVGTGVRPRDAAVWGQTPGRGCFRRRARHARARLAPSRSLIASQPPPARARASGKHST